MSVVPEFKRARFFVGRARLMECLLNSMREELLQEYATIAHFVPDAQRNLIATLRRYSGGYRVAVLDEDAGFFLDETEKRIVLNRRSIDLMMKLVAPSPISKALREDIVQILIQLYGLHESTHIPQGLVRFADVQSVKRDAGHHVIGELDLFADMSAARTLAALRYIREGAIGPRSYRGYVWHLRSVLMVMGEFSLKAFRTSEKPHKICRALGLAVTAARIDMALQLGGRSLEDVYPPLDAVVRPNFTTFDRVSMLLLAPDRGVWKADLRVNPEEFGNLCMEIDTQPFADSVAVMARILRHNGLA